MGSTGRGVGTARYHKLIKSALCSCFPSGLVSGTVPQADRGREGPCCPPELLTNPCQRWDESCDWAEEALSQCRPLCLKQRLLPSICPFPSTAERTPVPSTEPTTHSHLPGDLQSPSLANEGPTLPLVPQGAGDTHVTKAADATCSPDSVTSATVTSATAKPIRAPLLEKEPKPSSALTLDQRAVPPKCEWEQGSPTPMAWPRSAGDQATVPPAQNAKPGAAQERNHTETLPGCQEAPVVTVRERVAGGVSPDSTQQQGQP